MPASLAGPPARGRNPPPTPRQLEVLRAIARLSVEHGIPPTVREIADALGIRSTHGVTDHLRLLERKGLLERRRMKARALFLTDAGRSALEATTTTDAGSGGKEPGCPRT